MSPEKKSKPITKADLRGLATKKDLKALVTKKDVQGLAVRMGNAEKDIGTLKVDVKFLKDDFKAFRSEFDDFKGSTQTMLDQILKNTETLKQEMSVSRNAQVQRLHERLQRVEKKVGLPVEEYF